MVQRWDIGRDRGLGVFMEHDEFGEYVELKDYYALEERLAALEVMIDAAKLAGCTFVQKAPYTESSVECWVHDAERDRLAAENAELRKQCAAFHTEASDHYRAFLAANATLDKLRAGTMGRWDMPDKGTAATAIYSDGKFIGYGAYNQYTTILINTHNADCDAYEARIAELEATVARVKAESLRVVADGKQDCVYCGGTDIECIHCYGYGKPVVLKLWEEQG